MSRERDWTDLPFPEALAYLRSLRPMSDQEFDQIEFEVATASFVLSRITKMNMLQWVLDKLDQAVRDGQSVATFDAEIEKVLSNALSPAQIDTVFSSSGQFQFGAGVWQKGAGPDAGDEFWGWEYETQRDDRVRHTHALLDFRRFAIGEGKSVFPPWEWGCRCGAKWITREEAGDNAQSSLIPEEVQQALDDSTYASPALEVAYTPDLSGFHPALLDAYLRDQALVN